MYGIRLDYIVIIISALLSIFLVGIVGAAPSLDLSSDSGNPCEEVTIPITLTNDLGIEVSATSNNIRYNHTYLTPIGCRVGPAGRDAGKSIINNTVEPGLYRVAVFSMLNLTPIADGIVAYVTFEINCNAPAGNYQLSNSPSCSTPLGDSVDVDGSDGSIKVKGTTSSTTTIIPPSTTTSAMPTTTSSVPFTPTTTTSVAPASCEISISPTSARVASQETLSFTATVAGETCVVSQLEWSVESSIGSTIEVETGFYTAGINNTSAEATDIIIVWDKANEMSATAEVTVVAMIEPVPCEVSIGPLSATVASGETLSFTAYISQNEGCELPDYEWTIKSDINSTIGDSGNYQAGKNNTGAEVTDTVTVIDHANNSSAEATVKVSRLGAGKITLVFPNAIFSSHWIPLAWLLIIVTEDGGLKPSSLLSFDPTDDIKSLLTIGSGNIMIAFVLVSPSAQEGQYDVIVSTDDTTQIKEDGLTVNIFPWILGEGTNS